MTVLMQKSAEVNEFWAKFTRLLEARGLSQAELARRIGASNTTLQRWKKEGAAPSSKYLRAIASVLGVTVDELVEPALPGTPPPMSPRIASVAHDFGLDPSDLNSRAVAALRTFLREISPIHVTDAKQASYAAHQTGGKMPDVVDSAVWDTLTTEQQAGLALLLGGRHVEQWRIVAALELLFASPGPQDGGERVTGLVRAR